MLTIERCPGHWLWVGGPVPPGADAWTLGSLVIVRTSAAGSQHLMAHELEHVRQYEELGVVVFLVRYLLGYLSWRVRGYGHAAAYRRIPAEVSAEWRARRSTTAGLERDDGAVHDHAVGARRVEDLADRPPVLQRPE